MHKISNLVFGAIISLPGVWGFGSSIVNGKTQLLGNSFGVLAEDATYDYVVRSID
jgi:hypothetical protein